MPLRAVGAMCGGSERDELDPELRAHRLTGQRLPYVLAERSLEAILPTAVTACVEVEFGLARLRLVQLSVQIQVEQRFALGAGSLAHVPFPSELARDCLSIRRARCSLDITVPIGIERI